MTPVLVFATTSNSDGRLTQAEWAALVADLRALFGGMPLYGLWLSPADAPYQNCIVSGQVDTLRMRAMEDDLHDLAVTYRQDAIALTPGGATIMCGPGADRWPVARSCREVGDRSAGQM